MCKCKDLYNEIETLNEEVKSLILHISDINKKNNIEEYICEIMKDELNVNGIDLVKENIKEKTATAIVKLLIKQKNKEEIEVYYKQEFDLRDFIGKSVDEVKEIFYREVLLCTAFNSGFIGNNIYINKDEIQSVNCVGFSLNNVNTFNNIII